jgi:hypothetical protein
MIVSKEFCVRLDTNTYSVPFEFVGKSVFLPADDRIVCVRVLCDGVARRDRIARFSMIASTGTDLLMRSLSRESICSTIPA